MPSSHHSCAALRASQRAVGPTPCALRTPPVLVHACMRVAGSLDVMGGCIHMGAGVRTPGCHATASASAPSGRGVHRVVQPWFPSLSHGLAAVNQRLLCSIRMMVMVMAAPGGLIHIHGAICNGRVSYSRAGVGCKRAASLLVGGGRQARPAEGQGVACSLRCGQRLQATVQV